MAGEFAGEILTASSPRPGIGRLLVDIFVRPTRALTAIRDDPGRCWLVPAIIAIVVVTASVLLQFPVAQRAAPQLTQQQLQNMTPEQQAQVQEFTRPGSPIMMIGLVVGLVTAILGLFIGWLVRAGVLHVVALALGGQNRFGQMFSVVAWTRFPELIREIVQTIAIVASGQLIMNQGLSGLVATGNPLKDSTNLVYVLLSGVDIWLVWDLVLLTIGVAAAARFARRKAAALVVGYWVVTTLLLALAGVFLAGLGASLAGGVR
jgi:hypothetical protein